MNLRSVQASVVTNVAAATGGLTWCLLDAIRTRRYSAVSLCSGIVAGLVGITPAAGQFLLSTSILAKLTEELQATSEHRLRSRLASSLLSRATTPPSSSRCSALTMSSTALLFTPSEASQALFSLGSLPTHERVAGTATPLLQGSVLHLFLA